MLNTKTSHASQTYFTVLVLLAMSIPLSKFTMSVFQFALILIWFTDGFSALQIGRFFRNANPFRATLLTIRYTLHLMARNFIDKFEVFFHNRIAVVVASLFLIHVIGLVHTSDFHYALKDLRTKLPLLALPVILSTMPGLSHKQVRVLLLMYVLAVFAGTLISFNEFLKQEFTDIRKISLFISPIRFGLNIVFSFFILSWFVLSSGLDSLWQKALMVLLMAWFIFFLMILESAIGLISLILIVTGILAYRLLTIQNLLWRTILLVLLFSLPVLTYIYLHGIVRDLTHTAPVQLSALETKTALGNNYVHDTIHFGVEDGRYVGLYMAVPEMAHAWNQRSHFDFYGKDEAGQLIQYTIIRYLSSKDLRKDAAGVEALTEKDIRAIEKGIANVNYVENPSIRTRISKILMGYHQYADINDPNGSSVMQRIEYLKASFIIIEDNFWIGVGTGDLPMMFEKTYEQMKTPLKKQWRWRSHNQYLSIMIAFGVFGLVWFLFTLIYPVLSQRRYRNYLYTIFLVIIMLSMFTEDTIETQDGVTLFAFFNALFLFGICSKSKDFTIK